MQARPGQSADRPAINGRAKAADREQGASPRASMAASASAAWRPAARRRRSARPVAISRGSPRTSTRTFCYTKALGKRPKGSNATRGDAKSRSRGYLATWPVAGATSGAGGGTCSGGGETCHGAGATCSGAHVTCLRCFEHCAGIIATNAASIAHSAGPGAMCKRPVARCIASVAPPNGVAGRFKAAAGCCFDVLVWTSGPSRIASAPSSGPRRPRDIEAPPAHGDPGPAGAPRIPLGRQSRQKPGVRSRRCPPLQRRRAASPSPPLPLLSPRERREKRRSSLWLFSPLSLGERGVGGVRGRRCGDAEKETSKTIGIDRLRRKEGSE